MRTEEMEHAERERERESTSAYVNGQRIVTPGKNGTSGHPVPNPSGAEAIVSDR